jgi:hypothetical protein
MHCIASNTRVHAYIYYSGISNAKKERDGNSYEM